jgi:hypothetical protein
LCSRIDYANVMHIQWCLKGIRSRPTFTDADAFALLDNGIPSNWLLANPAVLFAAAIPTVQSLLSESLLVSHVNQYATVANITPYISLSAGVVLPDTRLGTRVMPAWETAVRLRNRFRKVRWLHLPALDCCGPAASP